MIDFCADNDFELPFQSKFTQWISNTVVEEGFELGELTFVFCDDEYLLRINKEFLNHDTYTDIITFDYTIGKLIGGEIYISTERVTENANEFNVKFIQELARVIIHGTLHLCGYKDKTADEKQEMRDRENHYLKLFELLSA